MILETPRLKLEPFAARDLVALIDDPDAFEPSFGRPASDGLREMFLSEGISAEWLANLRAASGEADPWLYGFAVVLMESRSVIGSVGFTGPPDARSRVEIAYCIAAGFRCQGFATEAVRAALEFAFGPGRAGTVVAHTLPESGPSPRVLTKCGFSYTGEIVDPVDGPVWRWEHTMQAPLNAPQGAVDGGT